MPVDGLNLGGPLGWNSVAIETRCALSLYLCYQSLLDPLTQTQVVAYLQGLAQAGLPDRPADF